MGENFVSDEHNVWNGSLAQDSILISQRLIFRSRFTAVRSHFHIGIPTRSCKCKVLSSCFHLVSKSYWYLVNEQVTNVPFVLEFEK